MIFLKEDTRARLAIIGDEISYYLQKFGTEPLEDLIDVDMSIRLMFKRLSTQKTYEEIDYLVISIGSREYYSDIMDITPLTDLIKEIFPNASYYVVEGFLVSKDLPFINEKDIEEIEKKRVLFYDEFEANDFQLIGTGKVMSYEPLDNTNTKLLKVFDFVSELKFKGQNKTQKQNKLGGDPFIKNVDISGDDKEDFSTIYDFLERFEEIVYSKNVYMKDNSSRYNPDVHQIEIALAFLMSQYEDYIQYEGIFDDETEDMVKLYQKKKGLKQTGIADNETMEDLLYDLKIKGFDDNDLGQYLGTKGITTTGLEPCPNRYEGGVDGIWDMVFDKVLENFEGGYWNPSCPNHSHDAIYRLSSETLFGIDRFAGEWEKRSAPGREFFGIIDDEKEKHGDKFCNIWFHGYWGGGLEMKLRGLASEMIREDYEYLSGLYLNQETKKAVESDRRLLLHFIYATWNGMDFFRTFAQDMTKAVADGVRCDDLVEVACDSRDKRFGANSNNPDFAEGNEKVKKLMRTDPDLKN